MKSALVALVLLGFTASAALAAGDYPAQRYGEANQQLNQVMDRIEDINAQLRNPPDQASGCASLSSLIEGLREAQVLAEIMAEAAYQADNMDAHRRSVDAHNQFLSDRHRAEDGYRSLCA